MSLFGGSITSLQNGLKYSTLKNQTIANNIANVDTANYKAKDVVFKDVLNNKMQNDFQAKITHKDHLNFSGNNSSFKIVSNNSTQYNHNGNNVDIDKEMTELANNQIYYQALVDRISGKFNSLQSVIRGGS
ncbi:flagellar basal body rod protein FlgB [Paraliobacillus quinghaiensis]|uniref:Flagellar basal body rod protein FlgB n=1 Tax=Paraliobacillus quinghaiensis TaxID=470815 RepID=A0A917THU5_9BACI|nr:flagellar basal body rod protein FlgB [Paraliobacillus quinghaiensis]GGM21344.1 flagellar basal body rod protein FlgB [Paraliobacillus quinghaiensis]